MDEQKLVKYSLKKNNLIPILSDGMLDYIKIHAENGLPVDLDAINNNNRNHFTRNLIYKGLANFEKIVSQSPLNQIKVCLEIVENNSINAFAYEIKGCTNPVYLVAINSGLVNEYAKHFANENTIKEMTHGFDALTQVPTNFLQDTALEIAFNYITYHELGHVFRGHLKYFRERYSANWLNNNFEETINLNQEEYDFTRHLFECDADAFAGSLLADNVLSLYESGIKSGLIEGDPKILLEELTKFCTSVIYYIFCLFDRAETNYDHWYPVPPIRTSIITAHLGVQLYDKIDDNYFNKLVVDALTRTQSTINNLGIKQTTKQLANEYDRWLLKYKEALGKLSRDLIPYTPIKL